MNTPPEAMHFYLRGGYQQPDELVRLAPLVEEAGFDGLTMPDHVFYPVHSNSTYAADPTGAPPFDPDTGWPDVWVLFGALGAVTSRLRFRVSVYVLPLRHPLVVARALGTAAIISNNRVELGVGVGHQVDEFAVLGVPFSERGSRTDEAIDVLRTVFRAGPVEYHGRWFDFDAIYLNPVPSRPVPIHIGGQSSHAHRRAARIGDGYVSFPLPYIELEALAARLRDLRSELAPERPPLELHFTCSDATSPDDYIRVAKLGTTSVALTPWPDPYHPPPFDERVTAIEQFAAETIRPVRAAIGSR